MAPANCYTDYLSEESKIYLKKLRKLKLESVVNNNVTSSYVFKNDLNTGTINNLLDYEHNENESGLFILFNIEDYQKMPTRCGTLKDEENLINCLSKFKYVMKEEYLNKNCTRQQVLDILLKISEEDHSHISNIIVVFLAHGDDTGNIILSDGSIIENNEILSYFTSKKCPTLKGKPKLFIFQACQGSKIYNVKNQNLDLITFQSKIKYTLSNLDDDMLLAYSSFQGYVSYRHTEEGTWFIQEICKNFIAYGHRDDLITMFKRICKCVSYQYSIAFHDEESKQIPYFISTLKRNFFLNKSKEVTYFIELQDQNLSFLEKLETMQAHLENIHRTEKDINAGVKNKNISCK